MKLHIITSWATPWDTPLIAFFRDADLNVPADRILEEMTGDQHLWFHQHLETQLEAMPTDPSDEELARLFVEQAGQAFKQDEERQKHQALLFHWNAMALSSTKPCGVVVNPAPAPLDPSDIEEVFKQLRNHPSYDNHTVMTTARDASVVRLSPEGIEHV